LKELRYRDSMVVGFTTTYAISTYHHWCCEFESLSGLGVKHYVIKIVSYCFDIKGTRKGIFQKLTLFSFHPILTKCSTLWHIGGTIQIFIYFILERNLEGCPNLKCRLFICLMVILWHSVQSVPITTDVVSSNLYQGLV
jgi:hypothetical protein